MAHTFNPSIWESYAFNPSTKEVETGRGIWLGRESNIRQEETRARLESEDAVCEDRIVLVGGFDRGKRSL